MKRKENNNLIVIDYNGEKHYYTSMTRIAYKLALATASVKWAIEHNNVLTDVTGRNFRIYLVDGSEIPYKLINND